MCPSRWPSCVGSCPASEARSPSTGACTAVSRASASKSGDRAMERIPAAGDSKKAETGPGGGGDGERPLFRAEPERRLPEEAAQGAPGVAILSDRRGGLQISGPLGDGL